VLAPIITILCNVSFQSATLPASHKQAVVLPRLKKPTLDLNNPSSYRPISNLTFLSKLIERLVAMRFVTHAEVNRGCFQFTSRHAVVVTLLKPRFSAFTTT